jgi:CRP-like cAMP-binding protein
VIPNGTTGGTGAECLAHFVQQRTDVVRSEAHSRTDSEDLHISDGSSAMFFTDPTSTRIAHDPRLIEAKRARTPHKREPTDPQQPSAGRRFLSVLSSFGRRGGMSTGFLNDSHELLVGHDRDQLIRLGRFFTVVEVAAGTTLGRQGQIAREFVTILQGEVGVTVDGIPHAVLDDGSHFGAVPLLANALGATHSASFTAMGSTRIAVANASEFHSMLSEFPLIAQRVRAITDVRRAYLEGLAQVSASGQTVRFDAAIHEYPVHAVQQALHV